MKNTTNKQIPESQHFVPLPSTVKEQLSITDNIPDAKAGSVYNIIVYLNLKRTVNTSGWRFDYVLNVGGNQFSYARPSTNDLIINVNDIHNALIVPSNGQIAISLDIQHCRVWPNEPITLDIIAGSSITLSYVKA